MNLVFQNITETRVCKLIASARKNVELYAPGITNDVAKEIVNVVRRGIDVRLVLDISRMTFRLRYFDVEVLKLLKNVMGTQDERHLLRMFNASGLRIGVLVVDEHPWMFAVHSRFSEPETSPCWRFPNGMEFMQPIACDALNENYTQSKYSGMNFSVLEMEPINTGDLDNFISEFSGECPKNIVELETMLEEERTKAAKLEETAKEAQAQVEKAREKGKAEGIKSYENCVRLRKVHFSMNSYMVQAQRIHLKTEYLVAGKHGKRLKASYALFGKDEKLPQVSVTYKYRLETGEIKERTITFETLLEEKQRLQDEYIHSLGRQFGNVILADEIPAFQADLEKLKDLCEILVTEMQKTIRAQAIKVLGELFDDIQGKDYPIPKNKDAFLEEMKKEIDNTAWGFNPEITVYYDIIPMETVKSESFQDAVCNMLECVPYEKKEKFASELFSKDIEIVNQRLRWFLMHWGNAF